MAQFFTKNSEKTSIIGPDLLARLLALQWVTPLFVFLAAAICLYAVGYAYWTWARPENFLAIPWSHYLLGGLGLAALALLFAPSRSLLLRLPAGTFLAGALLLFVISRLLWVILVPIPPVNDFRTLHELAVILSRGQPLDLNADSTNWIIFMYTWGYSLVLAGVYAVFGGSVMVGKLVNVFAGAITLFALYRWSECVINERTARIVITLFLLWPTQMFLTTMIAGENLSLMGVSMALWLFCSALKGQPRPAIRLFLAGIFLGLAYLTRFPMLVVLIACLMTLVVARRFTRRMLVETVLMLAGFALVNLAYSGILTRVYRVELPSRSFAGNLLVGVNTEHGGAWNVEDASKYTSFPIMQEANEWALQEALYRIRSQPVEILGLAFNKAGEYWRSDSYGVYWTLEDGLPELDREWLAAVYNAVHFYHSFVLLLAAAGTVWLAISRWSSPLVNTVLLPIIGSTLLHSVLEVQSRYHYPFEPLLFLLAALALAALGGWVERSRKGVVRYVHPM